MSISINSIHVNNSSFILICNEKRYFFWYKLQYIEGYAIFNIYLSNINKIILTFVS